MAVERFGSPIEVWLRKRNMAITCMVVREDETTEELDVDSLSMRGAEREMTGWFAGQGYKPVDRWENEEVSDEGEVLEAVRHFKAANPLVVDQAEAVLKEVAGFQF